MRFAILYFLLLAAPAFAQTPPLDWTVGGRITAPNKDADSEVVPAGTAIRCEVRVAGIGLIVNTTAGTTVPISGLPKAAPGPQTAAADCEWTVILPGVRGATTTALVTLRPWKPPQAPPLL